MAGSGNPCIYCGQPADSEEHILATWLIADLENFTGRNVLHGQLEYGHGLIIPLSVTTNAKGKRRFNFTSDTICARCNSGWMNQVDERARAYTRKLLRGQQVPVSGKMRKSIAAWAVKTAVTTRFAHVNPNPVEGAWAKQLRTHSSHLPSSHWFVWLARYVGGRDLWFRQGGLDIRGDARLDGGPEENPPTFTDGVVMTLVIGQICVQVLRINGPASPLLGADRPTTIRAWPDCSAAFWPPAQHIDDSSLEAFANRFYSSPMAFVASIPNSKEVSSARSASIFQSSALTPAALASNENYVLTIGMDCRCGTHTDIRHDTGGPLRELKSPYTTEVSYTCRGCGLVSSATLTIAHIPGQ